MSAGSPLQQILNGLAGRMSLVHVQLPRVSTTLCEPKSLSPVGGNGWLCVKRDCEECRLLHLQPDWHVLLCPCQSDVMGIVHNSQIAGPPPSSPRPLCTLAHMTDVDEQSCPAVHLRDELAHLRLLKVCGATGPCRVGKPMTSLVHVASVPAALIELVNVTRNELHLIPPRSLRATSCPHTPEEAMQLTPPPARCELRAATDPRHNNKYKSSLYCSPVGVLSFGEGADRPGTEKPQNQLNQSSDSQIPTLISLDEDGVHAASSLATTPPSTPNQSMPLPVPPQHWDVREPENIMKVNEHNFDSPFVVKQSRAVGSAEEGLRNPRKRMEMAVHLGGYELPLPFVQGHLFTEYSELMRGCHKRLQYARPHMGTGPKWRVSWRNPLWSDQDLVDERYPDGATAFFRSGTHFFDNNYPSASRVHFQALIYPGQCVCHQLVSVFEAYSITREGEPDPLGLQALWVAPQTEGTKVTATPIFGFVKYSETRMAALAVRHLNACMENYLDGTCKKRFNKLTVDKSVKEAAKSFLVPSVLPVVSQHTELHTLYRWLHPLSVRIMNRMVEADCSRTRAGLEELFRKVACATHYVMGKHGQGVVTHITYEVPPNECPRLRSCGIATSPRAIYITAAMVANEQNCQMP